MSNHFLEIKPRRRIKKEKVKKSFLYLLNLYFVVNVSSVLRKYKKVDRHTFLLVLSYSIFMSSLLPVHFLWIMGERKVNYLHS